MTREQLLSCALDISEQMLISGAEVGRVETTNAASICTTVSNNKFRFIGQL